MQIYRKCLDGVVCITQGEGHIRVHINIRQCQGLGRVTCWSKKEEVSYRNYRSWTGLSPMKTGLFCQWSNYIEDGSKTPKHLSLISRFLKENKSIQPPPPYTHTYTRSIGTVKHRSKWERGEVIKLRVPYIQIVKTGESTTDIYKDVDYIKPNGCYKIFKQDIITCA